MESVFILKDTVKFESLFIELENKSVNNATEKVLLENGFTTNQTVLEDHENSEEESDWEYYSDEEDIEVMLNPEKIVTYISHKDKLYDPYVKDRCLNMAPVIDLYMQVDNWVKKMTDINNSIGKKSFY